MMIDGKARDRSSFALGSRRVRRFGFLAGLIVSATAMMAVVEGAAADTTKYKCSEGKFVRKINGKALCIPRDPMLDGELGLCPRGCTFSLVVWQCVSPNPKVSCSK